MNIQNNCAVAAADDYENIADHAYSDTSYSSSLWNEDLSPAAVAGVLVLAVHSAETASESFDLFANHYLYAVSFLTAAAPNVAAPAAVYSSDPMTNQG